MHLFVIHDYIIIICMVCWWYVCAPFYSMFTFNEKKTKSNETNPLPLQPIHPMAINIVSFVLLSRFSTVERRFGAR